MKKSLLDVQEVAQYLGFSPSKIYRLVREGEIPCSRIGGQYRFRPAAIDEWLEEHRHATGRRVPGREETETILARVKAEADPLIRRLRFIGLLTRELQDQDIRPIVVGGAAVEYYSAGGYATGDVDLVSPGGRKIDRILRSWGFEKEGRHWFSEDLGMALEIPAQELAGDYDRLTVVDLEGLQVYLVGIEDLIIDRLCALVHWKSADDGNWARELAVLHRDQIDWKYLFGRAKEEKVAEAALKLKSGRFTGRRRSGEKG